jgi:hypothetical protein
MKRIVFRPCTPEDKGHDEGCPNGAAERAAKGPTQVATEDYRKGWDNVFGIRQPVGEA